MQNAIGRWCSVVTGLPADQPDPDIDPPARIVWANYDLGNIRKSYVSLQRTISETLGRVDKYVGLRPASATITIEPFIAGATIRVNLYWASIAIVTQADETMEEARDRLLAALQETFEPMSFAAGASDDEIAVVGLGGGPVRLTAIEGCTVAFGPDATFRITVSQKRYRVRVQLYAFDGEGADAIDEYADRMIASLQQIEDDAGGGLGVLASFGVGVQGVPPAAIDATAVSGALYERRLYFDVFFTTASVLYYPTDQTIEGVDLPVLQEPFPTT